MHNKSVIVLYHPGNKKTPYCYAKYSTDTVPARMKGRCFTHWWGTSYQSWA